MGLSDGAFFMIKHTPLPNGNHPILSPVCPMGVADTLEPAIIGHFFVSRSFHFSLLGLIDQNLNSKYPISCLSIFCKKNLQNDSWLTNKRKTKNEINLTLDCFWSFRNHLMNEYVFKRILVPCQRKEMCKIPTKNNQNLTKIFLNSHIFKQFNVPCYYFWSFSWIAFEVLEIFWWINATSKGFWPPFSRHLQNRLFLK